MFFANGAAIASWVPRIPEVRAGLGLGTGALGVALLGISVGGLAGALLSGPLIGRFGSRAVTVGAGLALGAALILPALAASWVLLLGALIALGLADGLADVGMNAHAVTVERGYARPIMSTLHAYWSMGALAGALSGSAAAGLGLAPAAHLAVAGAGVAGLAALSGRRMLDGDAQRRPGLRLERPTRAVGWLGLIAFCAAMVETMPQDWSAVYLADELDAAPGLAGLGYAAFAATMLVTRFVGDRVVARWGAVRTLRWGALLAGVGLGVGLWSGTVWAGVLGFAAVGAGVAAIVPVLFSTAGHLPGVAAGAAISMVALISRGGSLAGPPLIGAAADRVGLGLALGLVVVAALLMALLAPVVTSSSRG